MKKPKKQLTEAEAAKLDQRIKQNWVDLDKSIELMIKDGILKNPPKWYKKHTND